MRLSDEVVEQLARVRCLECGLPSIYPDDAFFAHYEAHFAVSMWNRERRGSQKHPLPVTYYKEYAYQEGPYNQKAGNDYS